MQLLGISGVVVVVVGGGGSTKGGFSKHQNHVYQSGHMTREKEDSKKGPSLFHA